MLDNKTSKKIFTVSELTYEIKGLLETKIASVLIKAEISNLTKHSSGHIYFTLKDEHSQIQAALFRNRASKLNKIPKSGDSVIIYGDLSVYPPRGTYQIIVREIDFLGMGELLLKLQKLKEEFQKKGYFDKKHKKNLPKFPKKIGVITSPTGAAIQDILNILNRRFSNFHLLLNPVKVQGETASKEIAKAIDDFNKYELADVLIVTRGGGSLEDLFAFNEKIVVDAIFKSKIPIISAVGHETDISISDFVADVRAPTPSAAAEIVISEKKNILESLKNFENRIIKTLQNKIEYNKNSIFHMLKQPIFSRSDTLFFKYFQSLDEIKNLLDLKIMHILKNKKELTLSYKKQIHSLNPQIKINYFKKRLNSLHKGIDFSINNKLFIFTEKLKKLSSHLFSLDPKNLLKKGYSILFLKKTNSIILSSKSVDKGKKIYALLHDGKINLTVD